MTLYNNLNVYNQFVDYLKSSEDLNALIHKCINCMNKL